MWDGKWAVIREIKGKQPGIVARFRDEKEARDLLKKMKPRKRKKRKYTYD